MSALAMSFVILVASVNWSINVHYCGDTLINFAFVGEAEGCGMEESDQICDVDAENSSSSVGKTCCTNKDLAFSGEDNIRRIVSSELVSFYHFAFVSIQAVSVVWSDLGGITTYPISGNGPPWLNEDILIKAQVFII